MTLLRRAIIPRFLLGVNGLLLAFLFFGNLQSILRFGPTPDSAFLCAFAGLLALACFWAAAGRTGVFSGIRK